MVKVDAKFPLVKVDAIIQGLCNFRWCKLSLVDQS